MDRRLVSRVLNDQRFKFLAVGGINTLVGYVLFAGLYAFVFADIPFGYLASLALSYTGAIVLAFFLYRRFVFPVTGHLLRDFARFVSVYAVSIGINALALPMLVELVRLDPLLAQAIILVSTTLVSYFGHRYFSFRRADPQDIATRT